MSITILSERSKNIQHIIKERKCPVCEQKTCFREINILKTETTCKNENCPLLNCVLSGYGWESFTYISNIKLKYLRLKYKIKLLRK